MHYWIIAVIAAIGATGGFMNVLSVTADRTAKDRRRVWQPGFLGVVIIGSAAAVGSWATMGCST